ncbi:MAG: PfkB family carbohydrate kinase [Candidatus Aminicenantes bacterium]|nr:PfkB family carbohydrate kinase [Candidatus Aminicenantes bacterium]
MTEFGLIGTITSDRIVYDDGRSYGMIGGVLYQAAVWCGVGDGVRLFTNCGEALRARVEDLIAPWPGLRRGGLRYVPGPGNQVELRYGESLKEREEVLRSAVPPLDPGPILAGLDGLDALLLAFNSGFDLRLGDWRSIVDKSRCPIWIDIHSLSLAKLVGAHRDYVALPEWRDWVRGAAYLQANRQEVACMVGRPECWAERAEIDVLAAEAFGLGVRAVFVTMGKEGVLVLTPAEIRMIAAPLAAAAVDTTGCGDVFAAVALKALAGGGGAFAAAQAGAALASRAVSVKGLAETFDLARKS